MVFEFIFGFLLLLTAVCYFLMIAFITAGVLRKSRTARPVRASARVSVILPVRNEGTGIIACLDDLALQNYPADLFEVIVSDDFSEDYTVEKVRRWAKEHPALKLSVLKGELNREEQQGKKKAIERAVAIASGEIILTTDADTFHEKSWIHSMSGVFRNDEIKMVLGPVGFTCEKGIFQKIQTLEFLGIIGVTAGSANLGIPLMCNGANLAYRKQTFIEAGGYAGNTAFSSGDDQFLMMKFREQFGKDSVVFLTDADAVTLTLPCSSWHDFWEQRLRWVSKSRAYQDRRVITAGILTIGFPLMILAGGVVGIFYPAIFILASLLWFLKILAEYPLVWLMARFFDKKHLLNYYFAAQVFQFFYSIAVAIAGQFTTVSWKGRRFRR